MNKKNINITAKRCTFKSFWIKQLFDECFHDWQILPVHILHKTLKKMFVLHYNIKVKKGLLKSFPRYY